MLALKALLALLGATALAAPAAVPGEVVPSSRKPEARDETWWCQWKHHVLFDTYTLEARNWGVSEGQLKKRIGCCGAAISDWGFEKTEDGKGFRAHWNLPLRMQHGVEDKLTSFVGINEAHGVICHKA